MRLEENSTLFAGCEEGETGPPANMCGSLWKPRRVLNLQSIRNWGPQSYNCKGLNSSKNPMGRKHFLPYSFQKGQLITMLLKF